MLSYPEVYILGRQVDGVYVEYSEPYYSKIEAELDKHHYEMGQSMADDAGSLKSLKYGRSITTKKTATNGCLNQLYISSLHLSFA